MANPFFRFKQFTIYQDSCAMKVTTDACLFGAWCAGEMESAKQSPEHILDIGTGTGLLSLMIAQKNKTIIDAVEIDETAAAQANENILSSPWKEHIHIYHSDITAFSFQRKYDRIISNPPFYENEIISGDSKRNTAHHSTELSLSTLLTIIKNRLSDTGAFYLLWPYKRKKVLEDLLRQYELFAHKIIFIRQSVAHDYFRIMLAGGSVKQKETATAELSIWNEQQQYTPAFVHLLKDYYLYL